MNLDVTIENVNSTLDTLQDVLKSVDQLDSYSRSFLEAVDCAEYIEAAEYAGEAVGTISDTIERVDNGIIRDGFEKLTGIELESVEPLTKTLEAVKDFFLDAREWLDDIPTEEWLPVAATVIMAAVQFKTGNIPGGLALTAKALSGLYDLAEANPEVVTQYTDDLPMAPELSPQYDLSRRELAELQVI